MRRYMLTDIKRAIAEALALGDLRKVAQLRKDAREVRALIQERP